MNQNNDNNLKQQLLSPINVVLGYIQLFEMDDNLTTSQKTRINEIYYSIEQILGVIKQLPDQAKDTFEYESEEIDNNNLILVVEDNLTNQELLLQQLEMLGYSADTANNGQEALDKLKQKYYPMVLTDLNMPLIDGYQLTKIIREAELETTKHTIIIAITANAFVGEEEKCLQLGMDAYLSKPLNIHDLNVLLQKWDTCLSYSQPHSSIQQQDGEDNNQIIDKSCLIRSIGNDSSKHLIVLKSYLKHAPQVIKDLCSAYKDRDIQQVRFFSHKIKSSSYSIGATELADANKAIEQAADDDNWSIIDSIAPNIQKLFKNVEQAIIREYFETNSD